MANYFEWDQAKLGLGIAAMDREHQQIVATMNKLHALSSGRAPVAALRAAVDDLVAITQTHFADEEAYMARIGFPGLAAHQQIHRTLLAKVLAHRAAFQRSGVLTDEFFAFLKTWLKAHICGIDVKYSEHRQAA